MPSKKEKLPLSVTHPELAKEAEGWDPDTVTPGSGRKLLWRCKTGHKYLAAVFNRTNLEKPTGCPVCSNRVIIPGENDLESLFPEIAMEADGWDAKGVSAGSSKKLMWKCETGHKYQATPAARTSNRKSGCPVCTNRSLLPGHNDLATTHPTISAEADGWDTSKFFAGSHEKLSWQCALGHRYSATISNRTSRGSGCPICSGKIVVTGFNDLATRFPEIAREAFEWDPATVSAGTHQKKAWKCLKGHIYQSSIAHRTGKNSRGCSVCAGKQIEKGFNDLASQFPEIAAEADGWDPEKVTPGIDAKLNWKCPVGHKYAASVGSRTNLKTNCPVCINFELLTGFNDLQTRFPLIAKEASGWDPSTVLAGSTQKLSWKCSKGHIYSASASNRTKAKIPTGCPKCGKYGFDSTSEGHLYLLEHRDMDMFQIGISNDINRRLKEHSKSGWELIETRGPMDGHLAQQWETSILRMLKARGADLSNSAFAGKFDGYSEAWSKSKFDVRTIRQLMTLTESYETEFLKKGQ